MSLIILIIVIYVEKNFVIVSLGTISVFFSLVFFGRGNLVLFFIRYELVIFPIIMIIYFLTLLVP